MAIPIIFIHKNIHNGDNSYLNYSLSQAHLQNQQNPIYLITDCKSNEISFVNYVKLNEYDDEAKKFAEIYKHMSTNDYVHEMFCFQRWFIIKKFIKKNGLNDFLYLDSDVLLFCNIENEFNKLQQIYDFTISNKIGPQCTYFTSKESLIKFCDFTTELYTNPLYFKRLTDKYQLHIEQKLPGGVCDMTAFGEYQHYAIGKVKDLAQIENNNVFDDNINVSDGFEMNTNGIKNITVKMKEAYCKQLSTGRVIRFNTLHFQGGGKKYMFKYYAGNNLLLQRLTDKFKVIKHLIRKQIT